MLVDIHCHLDFPDFDIDRDLVIKKCKDFGAIVCNGTYQESNEKVLSISKGIVKAALGLYPSEAIKLSSKGLKDSLDFIRKNKDKIVAIGEVGIDFFHIKDAKNQKLECDIFADVIKLANEIKKPLIVHSRKAEGRVLELLEKAKVPVDLHFYCGNAEQVKIGVERGYYFSIPTSVMLSKTLKKLAKRVPIDRILTETDAPYLNPNGRNDPSFIRESIKKIAELKNVSVREMEEQVWKNYQKFLRFD